MGLGFCFCRRTVPLRLFRVLSSCFPLAENFAVDFDKDEFLLILNQFLEKIRDKVGVSIGIESSESGYTRAWIERLGSLMGKDVAGLVLDGCVDFEIWDLVEFLIINGVSDHSCYSNLVNRLVAKKRLDLLCLCIKHASDLRAYELLAILKYFLCPAKH
nr:hypothetical protein CFP56_05705 [Quercus suber]